MKTTLTLMLFVLSACMLTAAVIHVPEDAASIQLGIDTALLGDTVIVAPGTYVENISFNGKRIVVKSQSGPEATIIDGNQNGSTVLMTGRETQATVLDGFTITNGNGWINDDGFHLGAGIMCRIDASPTLMNLIVEGNVAIGDTAMGGGIFCSANSNALIKDVLIRNNEADYGGGFCAYESSPTLLNVEIANNHGRTTNGGATFWASYAYTCGLLVHNNTATYVGAGVWVHLEGSPILNKATIWGNECTSPVLAYRTGGGIACSDSGSPLLINSIVHNNNPNSIEFYTPSAPSSIDIQYSDIEGSVVSNGNGTFTWGAECFHADPLLVDPENGNFSLGPDSPCIDAGSPYYVCGVDTVLNMDCAEYCGILPDLGWYETPHPPTVLHVPEDYATIQEAIDYAVSLDTVLVASGWYVENIDFLGKNIIVRSEIGPMETGIDGNQNGPVVTFANGESSAVLEGFTITGGSGMLNDDGHYIGGGIICRYGSSPLLRSLIIQYNTVTGDTAMGGGVMCSYGSNPRIEDVIINNNTAKYGGGIMAFEASPILDRVTIYANHAQITGGGFAAFNSEPELHEVLIDNNTAYYLGAGFWAHDRSMCTLRNVTITQNACTSSFTNSIGGGGILSSVGSNILLKSSIVWDNYPNEIEFYLDDPATPNAMIINYSDVQGGELAIETNANGNLYWGAGNLDADPYFCNPESRQFTVAEDSPVIGHGEAGTDMGAFGVGCAAVAVQEDLSQIPTTLSLAQNFPNPFNPTTQFAFGVPERSHIRLSVFDIKGRQVARLINDDYAAGSYQLQWTAMTDQGVPLPAGIYVYELTQISEKGEVRSIAKKFSLLK